MISLGYVYGREDRNILLLSDRSQKGRQKKHHGWTGFGGPPAPASSQLGGRSLGPAISTCRPEDSDERGAGTAAVACRNQAGELV